LFDSKSYETYCRAHPELTPLIYTKEIAKDIEVTLHKSKITVVSPGDITYVDFGYFGHLWYDEVVPLEDKDFTLYLVEGIYFTWENKQHTKISIKFPVFGEVYVVTNVFIQRYGYRNSLPEEGKFVLVDEMLVEQFPVLLRGKKKPTNVRSSKKIN